MADVDLAEVALVRRPPLGQVKPITGPRLSLRPLPPMAVHHLGTAPGAGDAAAATAALAGIRSAKVRTSGPGQFLVLSDEGDAGAVAAALGPLGSVTDLSHARAAVLASGPLVREMLAKLTSVDLAPPAFSIGASAATLCGHIAVHLTRVGKDEFEILVSRSFAASLWEELEAAAREYRG